MTLLYPHYYSFATSHCTPSFHASAWSFSPFPVANDDGADTTTWHHNLHLLGEYSICNGRWPRQDLILRLVFHWVSSTWSWKKSLPSPAIRESRVRRSCRNILYHVKMRRTRSITQCALFGGFTGWWKLGPPMQHDEATRNDSRMSRFHVKNSDVT